MSGPRHTYRTALRWSGSTGAGYDAYDRAHRLTAPPAAAELALTADPAFRGRPELLNPEQLLLAAASSCQLLSFLAVAARSRIDVVDYVDEASAILDAEGSPARFTIIDLAPVITVAPATVVADERLQRLVDLAHKQCYVANSLRTEVQVRATFVRAG